VSARVSVKTVEEIVKSIVEEQTGKKISSIVAQTAKVSRGLDGGGPTESVFDGYQINFVSEKPTKEKPTKQEPQFKEDKYE
jgi:hypothetical protein